jgi:heme/copper-type cytochrome/quinol oxidase subunit 2
VSGLLAEGVGNLMIRRSTAVVLIVFVILVAVAWYLQRNNNEETTDVVITSTPAANLFDLSTESVAKVQITKTKGDHLIMVKDQEGIWSFIEPAGQVVDQEAAQSIVGDILSLSVLTELRNHLARSLRSDKPLIGSV